MDYGFVYFTEKFDDGGLIEVFKAFENEVPTSNEPKSPGPRVNAIALICFFCIFACFIAASTTGMIFCWWARDASSGTTPPY